MLNLVILNIFLTTDRKYERYLAIENYFGNAPDTGLEADLQSIFIPLQHDGGELVELKQEIRQLIGFKQILKGDSQTFIDDLYNALFNGVEFETSKKGKDLLRAIYWEFEASRVVQKLAERFEISRLEFLEWNVRIDWFCLWLLQNYPNLALLLLNPSHLRCYYALECYELESTILYLPKFMVFNLRKCLSKKKACKLLLELALGINVRYTKNCPFPFSRKMAHYFTNAPKAFQIESAVWYAIVIGQEGSELMVEVFQKHFRNCSGNTTLINTLIHFFRKPANYVEAEELRRLLSYLQHLWDEEGSLNLKGWTLQSLRRREQEWQETLLRLEFEQSYEYVHLSWKGAPYQDFEYVREDDQATFRISQLTTARDLFFEGKRMCHCVGSYAVRCHQGFSSIWSLQKECAGSIEPLVTIEVNDQNQIVQAKRKYNAHPSHWEWELILRWASQEHIIVETPFLNH